jgi:hypothetical protein
MNRKYANICETEGGQVVSKRGQIVGQVVSKTINMCITVEGTSCLKKGTDCRTSCLKNTPKFKFEQPTITRQQENEAHAEYHEQQ